MVDALLSKLRKSVKEHRVMMPIEQLDLLDLAEVKIGNVRLIPFSSLKKETSSRFVRHENENKIWGDVTVMAESREAFSKGRSEIERAINLLRAYIPKLFPKECNIKIGLYKCDLKSIHYFSMDDIGTIHERVENLEPLGNYKLNKKRYDELKKNYCLNEISRILSKVPSSRSDLENSIIMAIRWLGLGVDDEVVSDKFLKYAIALECLLIKRGEKGDKTDPISERAAFLLGTTVEECKSKKEEVKLLYDIRSTIVHQGCEAEEERIIKDFVEKMYSYSMETLLILSKKTNEPDKWENIGYLERQMDERMFER